MTPLSGIRPLIAPPPIRLDFLNGLLFYQLELLLAFQLILKSSLLSNTFDLFHLLEFFLGVINSSLSLPTPSVKILKLAGLRSLSVVSATSLF